MSDFEDRIRSRLDESARTVAVEPDWDDLTHRLTRHDRRRSRGLAVALVLSLFAGPVLGFVAGRGSGDEDRAVAGGAADTDPGDGDGVATGDPVPTTMASGAGGAVAYDEIAGMSRYYPGHYASEEPMTRLFVRDVGAYRVRVHVAPVEQYDDGVPWWDPPGWCTPDRVVQVGVSTAGAVGIAGGNTFAALHDGSVYVQMSPMGVAEGEPAYVVVAQAPAGAALVRATFPGGATDEMQPVEGVAVLVAPAPAGTSPEGIWSASVSVEALDGGGAVVGTGAGGPNGGYDPYASGDCTPPERPMPEPGAEQPADPDAARDAVTALFALAYDGSRGLEERSDVIDDTSGWSELQQQLREGPFAEQVGKARAQAREIVFLSATRAAVRYDIVIEDYSTFGGRFGEAVFVDGRWKVTRQTMCHDLALAGVTCPS